MKKSEIQINIALDENNVPEEINWKASDLNKEAEAKAMILSLWEVEEMKFFIHQTILTLSDSFERATGDQKMAATMRDFCDYYAEKMNINGPM